MQNAPSPAHLLGSFGSGRVPITEVCHVDKETMQPGKQFRLIAPTIGIVILNGEKTTIMIPADTLLEPVGLPFDRDRFIEVKCEAQRLTMLVADLDLNAIAA